MIIENGSVIISIQDYENFKNQNKEWEDKYSALQKEYTLLCQNMDRMQVIHRYEFKDSSLYSPFVNMTFPFEEENKNDDITFITKDKVVNSLKNTIDELLKKLDEFKSHKVTWKDFLHGHIVDISI